MFIFSSLTLRVGCFVVGWRGCRSWGIWSSWFWALAVFLWSVCFFIGLAFAWAVTRVVAFAIVSRFFWFFILYLINIIFSFFSQSNLVLVKATLSNVPEFYKPISYWRPTFHFLFSFVEHILVDITFYCRFFTSFLQF